MTPSPSAASRRHPATKVGTVTVEIIGTDLPGRTCGPDTEGVWYDDVRVGLARGTDTLDEVPGDAGIARWQFAIDLAIDEDGGLDQRGPFVLGPRGERYLGLRWLRTDVDGRAAVFRAAKFRLFEMIGRCSRMPSAMGVASSAASGSRTSTAGHVAPPSARL